MREMFKCDSGHAKAYCEIAEYFGVEHQTLPSRPRDNDLPEK